MSEKHSAIHSIAHGYQLVPGPRFASADKARRARTVFREMLLSCIRAQLLYCNRAPVIAAESAWCTVGNHNGPKTRWS